MAFLRNMTILFLAAAFFCAMALADSGVDRAENLRIKEVEIRMVAESDDAAKWTEFARELIQVHALDIFSQATLDQSVEVLKNTRRFKEIRVEFEDTPDGRRIRLVLEPFRLIRAIRISGAYPLFHREIEQAMTVFTGGVHDPSDMETQAALVADAYRREGFPQADVRIEAREHPRDGGMEWLVHIHPGPSCYLDTLRITGNRFLSTARLKSRMETWRVGLTLGPAGRFTEVRLRKDIQSLKNLYLTSGFAEASIEYAVTRDEENRLASVSVYIDEGPRYRFAFESVEKNRVFRKGLLQEDVAHMRQGRTSGRSGIRRAIHNIRARYQAAGYLETQVVVLEKDTERRKALEREVVFRIQQGVRTRVANVIVQGNEKIPESVIRKQMLTRPDTFWRRSGYNPDLPIEDREAIRALYLQNGFQNVRVRERVVFNPDRTWVDVFFDIEENRQTLVSEVVFQGLDELSEEEIRPMLRLKPGSPFHPFLIRNDENALSAAMSEKGYPLATVSGAAVIGEDEGKARIEFRADKGTRMSMGGVYYSGNFRTRTSIMDRETRIRRGEPFSLKDMLEAQRNIRNLDVFRSVKFQTIGLNEKWDTVHLLVDVEEKKPYSMELGLGFESDTGVYLQGIAADNNLFGLNKKSWMVGRMSETGDRIETGYGDPRFLGTRTTANVGLYRELQEEFNKNFATEFYGATVGFNRPLVSFLSAGLSFRYEQREQVPRGDPAARDAYGDSFFDPRTILVTTPSLQWDSRDSFIRPRKGLYAIMAVDVSKGIRNSLDNFCKYRLDVRGYAPLSPRITVAAKCTSGLLEPFKDTDIIPEDQLFFLGGTNSVRGFDENMLQVNRSGNSLGGALAVSGNLEIRMEMGRGFEMACFYDIGRVSDFFGDYGDKSFRKSVGGGIRYITPIGPVGLLYGRKLERREGESSGRIHFSLGYTF